MAKVSIKSLKELDRDLRKQEAIFAKDLDKYYKSLEKKALQQATRYRDRGILSFPKSVQSGLDRALKKNFYDVGLISEKRTKASLIANRPSDKDVIEKANPAKRREYNLEYAQRLAKKQSEDYEQGLKRKLDKLFADALVDGRKVSAKEMKEAIKQYSKSFQNVRTQATVTTEVNRVANDMRMDLFRDIGVEKVVYTAVLDDRTTPLCQSLNGRILRIDDPLVAQITPPNHVHCRSYWVDIPIEKRSKVTTQKVMSRLVNNPQLSNVREVMDIG